MNPTSKKIKDALRSCAGEDCTGCYYYKNKFTCQQDLVKDALEYVKYLEGEVARNAAFEKNTKLHRND